MRGQLKPSIDCVRTYQIRKPKNCHTRWEPLSNQYKKELITLMYNVNSNNTPVKITNLFSIAYPCYDLRNSNVVLPRYSLDIARNSLRCLKWKASLNSLLLRAMSTSLIGMNVGQLDAARSAALLVCSGRTFFLSSRLFPKCAYLSLQLRWCSVLIAWLSGSLCVCATTCLTSGSVIVVETSLSKAAIWHGFVIPRPPIIIIVVIIIIMMMMMMMMKMTTTIINNYSPKWRWIVVDIYRAEGAY